MKERGLDGPGGPLVVGVSGGPDSVCLLHVLASLRERRGFEVHAAHLDHQLRGEESVADAAYVKALCEGLGVPLAIEAADVQGYRRRRKLSLEEAGRHERYGFFAALAEKLGARAVFLGHTADDQAETVLMHILRGSGLAGLRGMEPLSRWRERGRRGKALTLARPLLGTWRRETEAYCRENGLEPRIDSSNRSLEFLRNRLRLQVLPLLRQINPKADAALLRLAESAGEASLLLEGEAARAWRRGVRVSSEGVAIGRHRFLALPPAVASHLLRRAVEEARGDLAGIEAGHLTRMRRLAAGPTGKRVTLPGGVVFSVDYEELRLIPNPSPCPMERGTASPLPLSIGDGEGWTARAMGERGVTLVPGWEVRTEVIAPPNRDALSSQPAYVALLDSDAIQGDLRVRFRRPGDLFQPLGMRSSKKLQDFLADAKVPRSSRDFVPLLCDGHGILWVAGYRIDHRARVREDTRRVLRVELVKTPL